MKLFRLIVLLALSCLFYAKALHAQNMGTFYFMRNVKVSVEIIQAVVPFKAGLFSREEMVKISGVLFLPQDDAFLGQEYKKPYPLAIVNHGSQDSGAAIQLEYSPFVALLLKEGYAVFQPIRKGFYSSGFTEVPAISPQSSEPVNTGCSMSAYQSGIKSAAEDVFTLTNVLLKSGRTDINFSRIILAGSSRGGILSLSLAISGFPGLIGVINFVGGWHGEASGYCYSTFNSTKFKEFAEKLTVPSVSFYAATDTYYSLSAMEGYVSSLSKNPKSKNFIITGYDHRTLLHSPSAWEKEVLEILR